MGKGLSELRELITNCAWSLAPLQDRPNLLITNCASRTCSLTRRSCRVLMWSARCSRAEHRNYMSTEMTSTLYDVYYLCETWDPQSIPCMFRLMYSPQNKDPRFCEK